MIYSAPSVLRKHGGRHALVIKKGKTRYEVIEMTNAKLLLKSIPGKELEEEGYVEQHNQSPAKVAEHFLQHQAGVTPNAELALCEVIALRFLE